jgi:hypothetical protein
VLPTGNRIQRRLRVPSDHSGYCGENATISERTSVDPGRYRPVSLSSRGNGVSAAAPAVLAAVAAKATIAVAVNSRMAGERMIG